MNCPSCQQPNREGAKFCANCRSPLPVAPTVPPPPAAIPPVNAAQPSSAPAQPATAANPFPWKNFGIGCGVFLLGMICGMLALGVGSLGVGEWQKRGTTTPAASPSATPQPGAATPAPSPIVPTKPGGGGPGPRPREGDRPQGFTLKDVHGQDKVFLDLIKDKPAVLMFWKPEARFDEMLAALQNSAAKGIVPVVVTPDKDAAVIKKYLEERGWDKLIVLMDGERVKAMYGVDELPACFLIRKNGTIAKRIGRVLGRSELEKELDELPK